MTTSIWSISRRTAMAGIGAGGLGAALLTKNTMAANAIETVAHRFIGSWMVMNNPPNIAVTSSDGTILNTGATSSIDPNLGAVFSSPYAGTWEAIDEVAIHATMVWFTSDAEGNFVGSAQLDGYPVLAEDGNSWLDDGSKTMVTIRDASNKVTLILGGDGSLAGHTVAYRMGVGNPGFPSEDAATPAS